MIRRKQVWAKRPSSGVGELGGRDEIAAKIHRHALTPDYSRDIAWPPASTMQAAAPGDIRLGVATGIWTVLGDLGADPDQVIVARKRPRQTEPTGPLRL